MENELITSIANIGFPAVVCLFLLIRIEGKIEKLSNAINELNKSIAMLAQDKK